jgi:MFS family permease
MNRADDMVFVGKGVFGREFISLLPAYAYHAICSQILPLFFPILIYKISNSAMEASAPRSLQYVAISLLASFSGVIVDKFSKKRIILSCTVVSTIATMALSFLVDDISSLSSAFVVFIYMVCGYIFFNSSSVEVKRIVPPNSLMKANSYFSIIDQVMILSASSICMFLISFGVYKEFIIFLGALGIFSILVTENFLTPGEYKRGEKGIFALFIDGWRALRADTVLFRLTIVVLLSNSVVAAIGFSVIPLASTKLHLSDALTAVVIGMTGVGGLLGGALAPWIRSRLGTQRFLKVMLLSLGLSCLLLAVSDTVYLAVLAIFAEGFSSTAFAICVRTIRQQRTPPEYLGRVSGLTGALFKFGMPIAILGCGIFIEMGSAELPMYLAAGIILICLLGLQFVVFRGSQSLTEQ